MFEITSINDIKLLGARYLVAPIDNWHVMQKGTNLFLPQFSKPSHRLCKILKVGPGGYADYPKGMSVHVPCSLKEGDYVLIVMLAGDVIKVKVKDKIKKIWIVHEDEILLQFSELPKEMPKEYINADFLYD